MKFRASYSILNSWSKGYAKDAIEMYFKVERETNQFMLDGIKFHKSWQQYIEKNKRLHPQLSTHMKPLNAPKCEIKLEMPLTDKIDLVGIIDCLDDNVLYEFKSGVKSSSEYANNLQADVYSILCKYHGYEVDRAFYHHFDQYLRETDCAMVWLTQDRMEKAKAWVIEQATDMENYLVQNKYYEKYKEIKPVELIEEAV